MADNWLFRCATAEEVYDKLDALYPQLQAPRVDRGARGVLERGARGVMDSNAPALVSP